MIRLVVKSAADERLLQLDFSAVEVMDGGADGVPPVGVEVNVASRSREQGIALAQQVEAGVELRHAAFMLDLNEGQGITPGRLDAAHGLYALDRPEPVQRQKRLIGADAHDAAASQLREMQGVIMGIGPYQAFLAL